MQSIRKLILVGWVAGGVCLVATGAWAHHSNAMFAKDVTEITGTVTEFQWTNPHSWIQVDVETAPGQTEAWSIEWGSPNSLGRRGFRSNTFTPGAQVTMQINPMRDGSPAGVLVAAKFADGKMIGTWLE